MAAAGSVEVVTLVVAAGACFAVVAGSRLVIALIGARVGPTWIVVARCSPVISMTLLGFEVEVCSSLIEATVVPAASDSRGSVVLAEVEEVKDFADVVADVEISEELGIVEEVDSSGVVSRVEVGVACGAGVAACTVEGAEVAAASDDAGVLLDDCAGVLTEIEVVLWGVLEGAIETRCVVVEEVDTTGVVARVAVDCCAAVRVVVTVEVVSCAGVTACTVDGAEVAATSDEVGCLVEDCAGVLTEIAVVFWVVVVDGACEGCCVDVAAPTGDGAEVGTVDDGAGSSLEGAEVVVGDGSDGAEGCWFEVVSSTSSGWAAMYSRRFSLA